MRDLEMAARLDDFIHETTRISGRFWRTARRSYQPLGAARFEAFLDLNWEHEVCPPWSKYSAPRRNRE